MKADAADRSARLAAQFEARGIELTEHQAAELVVASDRLHHLKATMRAAATKSAPRRS